ncbi:MAG TPA: hypothetical protein P5218_09575, partial [Planctomycetota bacterium]|nr:hypothetical protein [Planctomycetota bacterium]
VRGSLIRALEQEVPSEALEPALEVAMRCLRAQRLPVKAEDFDGDLRRVATRSAHPLARTLLDWGSTLTRPPEPQEPMGSSELVLPQ